MTGRSAVLALGSDAGRLRRPVLRTAAGGIVALAGPAAVTLLSKGGCRVTTASASSSSLSSTQPPLIQRNLAFRPYCFLENRVCE